MSKTLVLTLGHNASAICIIDGQIVGGYEEERFTKVKSDSSFPINSIRRLQHYFGERFDDICVGHWFTGGNIVNSKYVDMDFLKSICDGQICSIADGLTHHDTHMLSARPFALHHGMPADHMVVVADGFGTYGECITIYKCDSNGSQLLARYFGYSKSLGMLYQYATAYLEMKMHNHEYKMLGYEAHIAEVIDATRLVTLHEIIVRDAEERVKAFYNDFIEKDTDPLVNTDALAATQHGIANLLDSVLERLELNNIDLYTKRVIISYYVQGIVETVMSTLVGLHKPQNLVVVGGLFYNVKLNHLLADMVEKFAAMPLAGDQGAGLGVYYGNIGRFEWPGHLAWGHRDLSNVSGDGIIVVEDMAEAVDTAHYELTNNRMINVVRGAMEFGPRSLCNTATLAIPTMDVVERINKMNDRTTVMPMAPAMTAEQAAEYLNGLDNIVGSLEYMIVTRDVKLSAMDKLQGASHFYKLKSKATCRPQIIGENDLFMTTLLNEFGPLINTSFNYHGVPIAFDKETIEYSHNMQNQVAPITTIVIK